MILADDAGHRALPVRLRRHDVKLWRLLSRPDDHHEEQNDDHREEMTGRLLQAAGVTLAGVTVTDLGPGVTATRIDIAGPGGTRPVTASLADGLTLAVITGAPLAAEDPVMDGSPGPSPAPSAQPVPQPAAVPPAFAPAVRAPQHGVRRRTGPMAARRHLPAPGHRIGLFRRHRGRAGDPGRGRARAAGFAFLAQDIEPDDYRGRTVTFRGELRTAQTDGRAGLVLRVTSPGRSTPSRAASPDPREDPANHIASVTGTGAWTQYEVTAQIPADASLITFGVFLHGGGQVELRHPELAPHPPGHQ